MSRHKWFSGPELDRLERKVKRANQKVQLIKKLRVLFEEALGLLDDDEDEDACLGEPEMCQAKHNYCSHCKKLLNPRSIWQGLSTEQGTKLYCSKCWELVHKERRNYYQDSQGYRKALVWLANCMAEQDSDCPFPDQQSTCGPEDCRDCFYQTALLRAQNKEVPDGGK